jgi:hypothetical protein
MYLVSMTELRGDVNELNEIFNGKRHNARSRNMTGRLHAPRWQRLQRLLDVDQRSVREGRDIHRVLYPRLFWEHPLQRCAVNPCIRLCIRREMKEHASLACARGTSMILDCAWLPRTGHQDERLCMRLVNVVGGVEGD